MQTERAMRVLEETCENLIQSLEMANDELRRQNGAVDSSHSPLIRDLTHGLKNVLTCKAMLGAEGGYGANESGGEYGRRMRDSMGRYRDDGNGYGASGGYSRMYRHDGKEQMMEKLEEAMSAADDQQTRQILEDAKRRLKNM